MRSALVALLFQGSFLYRLTLSGLLSSLKIKKHTLKINKHICVDIMYIVHKNIYL